MSAIGVLASNSAAPIFSVNGFYQRGGALPTKITTPIVQAPTNIFSRVSPPPTPTPVPAIQPAKLMPRILTTVAPPPPTTVGDAPPQGAAVQPAPSGASSADQSTPGGTGTSDLSRLLDTFASLYAPRELTPALAPTSVVETGTSNGSASGGSNYGIVIVIAIALLGGVWWYMKHKAGAA